MMNGFQIAASVSGTFFFILWQTVCLVIAGKAQMKQILLTMAQLLQAWQWASIHNTRILEVVHLNVLYFSWQAKMSAVEKKKSILHAGSLSHCQELLGHLNRTEQQLMLLVTPVLWLVQQVNASAAEKVYSRYFKLKMLNGIQTSLRKMVIRLPLITEKCFIICFN